MLTEDAEKLVKSSKINPEFGIRIDLLEQGLDSCKIAFDLRNASKQEFHTKLIHFLIKTFKN